MTETTNATQKEPLTKKEVVKKVVNISLMILQVLIVLLCIATSIMVIIQAKSGTKKGLNKGINLMPVLSNSMDGSQKDSFKKGTLLIVKGISTIEEYSKIKKGDVVTFVYSVEGKAEYVTHRVLEVTYREELNTYYYKTIGDYAVENGFDVEAKSEFFPQGNLRGVYLGQIPVMGAVINFFQADKWRFFGFIIVPLILLLIYNAWSMLRFIFKDKEARMQVEKKEAVEAATAATIEALRKSGLLGDKQVADIGMLVNNQVTQDSPITPTTPTTQDSPIMPTTLQQPVEADKVALNQQAQLTAEQQSAKEEEIKAKAISDYIASQKAKK